MAHRETCICVRCQGRRRKARREAERPRRLPAEDFAAELVELRRQGRTYRELAKLSGLSVGTVHRILNADVRVNPRSQKLLSEMA
jgi:DNA invertase Pin-like site-specific DNA recombinase